MLAHLLEWFAGMVCQFVRIHFSQARLVGESDVRSWPPTEEMMFELERQDWDSWTKKDDQRVKMHKGKDGKGWKAARRTS